MFFSDNLGPIPLQTRQYSDWHAAARLLDDTEGERILIQDYRPLADSLEWELGQSYWQRHGSQAFVGLGSVPFLINNDGIQSMRAAELLFTSLQCAKDAGQSVDDIVVLELGIGVGLFARLFLDWFRHLCEQTGMDYYDRLTYVAADRSWRMLRDATRHAIFLNHPGRYRLQLVDAQLPAQVSLETLNGQSGAPIRYQAVFFNYVLDCLPATVIRVEGGITQELHIRTWLPSGIDWRMHLDVDADGLGLLGNSTAPADRCQLIPVYDHFLLEYQYRPADLTCLPYGAFMTGVAKSNEGRPILHNYGAIQYLEASLAMLADGGFVLINDYGQTKDVATDEFRHQRFGQTAAVGINFALLREYFSACERGVIHETEKEQESLHSRLLTVKRDSSLSARFQECFGETYRVGIEKPVERGRELLRHGLPRAALAQFRQALERQPLNWSLMLEVAQLLNSGLGNGRAGVEMARLALEHNPAGSPEGWDILGDCLVRLGRIGEAKWAYCRALALNSEDVGARHGLSMVYCQTKEYAEGLRQIAEGLAVDHKAMWRAELLRKQMDILGFIQQRDSTAGQEAVHCIVETKSCLANRGHQGRI